MLEKLDFMLRFWELKARHLARTPLTPLERGELWSLLSLMVIDDPMPGPGAAGARPDGLPAQVATACGFVAAEVRYVCAAGLVVVTAAPITTGQSTIVRLSRPARDSEGGSPMTGIEPPNADAAFEQTLPCVVEWTYATTMALRVDGAPTRMSCVPVELGAWGVPLGCSDPTAAPDGHRALGSFVAPS